MARKPMLGGKNVTCGLACRDCKQAYKKKPKKMAKPKRKPKRRIPRKKRAAAKNTKRQFLNPFFVFLKEFRRTCKLIKATEVTKSAGAAWRSMNRMEKAPYIIKSKALKKMDEAREMKKKGDKPADGNKDPDEKLFDEIVDVDKSGAGNESMDAKKSPKKRTDNEETQRKWEELKNKIRGRWWKYGRKDGGKKDGRKSDGGTSNE